MGGDRLSISRSWSYVGSSSIGTSHITDCSPCQDFSLAAVLDGGAGPVLFLAGADGAGTAELSHIGAALACRTIEEQLTRYLAMGGSVETLPDEALARWYEAAAEAIAFQAEISDRSPREYACTLLVAVVDPAVALYAQLGDGAIVVGEGGTFRPVFWPQSGEYANSTYFLTAPEHHTRLVIERAAPANRIALFTDGIQSLALHYSERAAHAPFFAPMFARLCQEPPGEAAALQEELAAFLDSAAVNRRTDDDKTLLLACLSRAVPPS